jgi:hypothetical protein
MNEFEDLGEKTAGSVTAPGLNYSPEKPPNPRNARPGFIYLIQAFWGGPIKVGWSSSERGIRGRLCTIQVGNPYQLRVVGFWRATMGEELALHVKLAAVTYRACGEWFHVNRDACRTLREAGAEGNVLKLKAQGVRVCSGCAQPIWRTEDMNNHPRRGFAASKP